MTIAGIEDIVKYRKRRNLVTKVASMMYNLSFASKPFFSDVNEEVLITRCSQY